MNRVPIKISHGTWYRPWGSWGAVRWHCPQEMHHTTWRLFQEFRAPNIPCFAHHSESMAGSALVHAAVFADGALVGGSVAAAVASRKREIPHAGQNTQVSSTKYPIIEVGPGGNAQISKVASSGGVIAPPLRYGNPGVFLCLPLV